MRGARQGGLRARQPGQHHRPRHRLPQDRRPAAENMSIDPRASGAQNMRGRRRVRQWDTSSPHLFHFSLSGGLH